MEKDVEQKLYLCYVYINCINSTCNIIHLKYRYKCFGKKFNTIGDKLQM
ncbi:MAG: hypothetical protein ACJAV5_001798 [Vicingaceae bacterium]|jgi:hypothetical protein